FCYSCRALHFLLVFPSLLLPPPPLPTLFPYTTLFRSSQIRGFSRKFLHRPEKIAAVPFILKPEIIRAELADSLRQLRTADNFRLDRKSTRLNSSHVSISYAVFCLKKKK